MNYLKFVILSLTIWALPSFVLAYFNASLGSSLSYLTYLLLVSYFLLKSNRGPVLWAFVLMGLSYYIIAGFNRTGFTDLEYIILIVKFLIVIVCGAEVIRQTSLKELYIFLLLGAASIIIHAIFFPLFNAGFSADYGRYSGFYLNPNGAGSVCLMGFALSFGIKNSRLRYFGQLILTVAGFVTFSRSFLLMWLLINFLSVFVDKKNIRVPLMGCIGLAAIFIFSSSLQLNMERFGAIKNIFVEGSNGSKVLQEDSRTETWASYKNIILDKPILGNGYKKLQGHHFGLFAGVHNTFLLVIGEAGILPFLFLVGIYFFFLWEGWRSWKQQSQFTMLALVLFTALLVSHNFFEKFYLLFCSMYLFIVFTEHRNLYFDFNDQIEPGRNSNSRGNIRILDNAT